MSWKHLWLHQWSLLNFVIASNNDITISLTVTVNDETSSPLHVEDSFHHFYIWRYSCPHMVNLVGLHVIRPTKLTMWGHEYLQIYLQVCSIVTDRQFIFQYNKITYHTYTLMQIFFWVRHLQKQDTSCFQN